MWCEMERMTFINKYKCIFEVEIKIMNLSLKNMYRWQKPITGFDGKKNKIKKKMRKWSQKIDMVINNNDKKW
jgi:hypothetical protein